MWYGSGQKRNKVVIKQVEHYRSGDRITTVCYLAYLVRFFHHPQKVKTRQYDHLAVYSKLQTKSTITNPDNYSLSWPDI